MSKSKDTGAPMISVLREAWADPKVALPAYATAGAAGADIRANFPSDLRDGGKRLAPMARALVPTGLCMAIPPGYEVQLRPRSGLAAHHGLTLLNTPGTIDCDYRGRISVLMINLSDTPFVIHHGTRIAQMLVAPVVQAQFELAQTLDETPRGQGGFGSTGVR